MPIPASRLNQLPPYVFVTIARRVKELTDSGKDVIRLDIGNPDMPPPPHVVDTLAQAAANPTNHGYAGYRGTAAFRQAVAEHYQRRFGVTLDSETEVLPLLGSKEGIVNLMMAFVDQGTAVIVPEIGYPAYEMGARLAGGETISAPMLADENYTIAFDQLAPIDTQRARLMWINYPNNPTGGVADQAFYQRAVDFCRENDILLASDNPYVEISYDGSQAGSVLQANGAREVAVEFMSFSKSYNMAGWRLGAAVGNADALKHLLHVKSNMDSGHFKAIYDAGIAALEQTPQSWLDKKNAIYQRRRDLIMETLPQIGLAAKKPRGAMYVWAKLQHGDAAGYIQAALNEAHISIAPGEAYGPGGKGYVRLSVSVPDARLQEALERLKIWSARW